MRMVEWREKWKTKREWRVHGRGESWRMGAQVIGFWRKPRVLSV